MTTNPELDVKMTENTKEEVATLPLEVNVNELNIILSALQELPHRVADPILKNLFSQAQKHFGTGQ